MILKVKCVSEHIPRPVPRHNAVYVAPNGERNPW